jgi:hypothetical protein
VFLDQSQVFDDAPSGLGELLGNVTHLTHSVGQAVGMRTLLREEREQMQTDARRERANNGHGL